MDDIVAYILAGGRSQRLGQDKVALALDGHTLLARTAALARELGLRALVSGRDPAELGLDLAWLPDAEPGTGPLGGILTGLGVVGGPLLALACDLPLLDRPTLERLLDERTRRPSSAVMTTFLHTDSGFIEPLVAVYEPQARPFLEAARARGVRQLSLAIPPAVRHHVSYGPQEPQVFFNINFPQDLEALARVRPAGAGQSGGAR